MKILILRDSDGYRNYDTIYDGSNVDIREVERYVDNLLRQLDDEEFTDGEFERGDIPALVEDKFDLKELYDVIDVIEYGY